MRNFFARRTSWNLTPNRYTEALEAHRRAGREVLDLTASNPTTIGLHHRESELLGALSHAEASPTNRKPRDCSLRAKPYQATTQLTEVTFRPTISY